MDGQPGIAVHQPGGHAAHGFDGQGQGRHVQQQYLALGGQRAAALQYLALYRRALGHALVGIDASGGLLAGEAADHGLNRGDAGGAAHQQNPTEVGGGDARVPHGVLHRARRALHQVGGEAVKFRTGQAGVQMQRGAVLLGDEGQGDLRRVGAGQLLLGGLRGLLKAAQRGGVPAQVDAVLLLEGLGQVIHHTLVEVVAAQVVVA